MKRCTKCRKKKDISEFHKNSCAKDGHHTRCKVCQTKSVKMHYQKNRQATIARVKAHYKSNKDEMYRKKYGLYPGEYTVLAEKQNNACAICGTKQEDLDRSLAVDHDHVTGIIRGLLCGSCNRGIGYFKDSIERLEKTIEYLKKSVTQIL